MSSRESVLGFINRYGAADVESIYEAMFKPRGLTKKAAERTLANLQHDGLTRSVPFIGNRRVYMLTAKAARRFGRDERKHRRAPGRQVVCEHYTVLRFCIENSLTLYTPSEFARDFPHLANYGRTGERRYFLDRSFDPPIPSLILPDYAGIASTRKVVKRAKRAVQDRRKHAAWR